LEGGEDVFEEGISFWVFRCDGVQEGYDEGDEGGGEEDPGIVSVTNWLKGT
jgi:hypothetical protein